MTGTFAVAPALPLHTAGPYVAAAYVVFVALILVYVAIMARKQMRTERELRELRRQLATREELDDAPESAPELERRAQERIA
jgi:CcmD family protein